MRTSMYREGTRRSATLLFSFIFTLLPQLSFAESGRADYDIDDDGLIEINDLDDLNEIRNHLDGSALYGVNTGCPVDGCNGFELTTDLDFDLDGGGEIEEAEEWTSLSTSDNKFTAIFKGNYHTLSNLRSDNYSFPGLFGYIEGARIEQLVLDNVITIGHTTLAYSVSNSTISEVISRGSVISTGKNSMAGLVGRVLSGSVIEKSIFDGLVSGYNFIAGFAIEVDNTSTIRDSFSAGVVTSRSSQALGGFVAFNNQGNIENSYSVARVDIPFGGTKDGFAGDIWDKSTATNSYWDTEASTAPNSFIGEGFSTKEMLCPVSASDVSCAQNGAILYENWDSSIWNFGTSQQYPGLIINGEVIRPVVSDFDEDGIADYQDAFKYFAGASVDADYDGIADACHVGFEADCVTEFGIEADAFLNDTDNDGTTNDVATDDDGDGIDDVVDAFPFDASESIDSDGDGVGDNRDFDDDGNGFIELRQITDLESIRQLSDKYYLYDGCASIICKGFELVNDLNFDTNDSGDFDAGDHYWNDGQGWEPLVIANDIVVRIEGNNHAIKNLFIDRSGQVGLIYSIDIGNIKQLKIEGQVKGTGRAGLLSGYARSTTLTEILAVGSVSSTGSSVGGLLGNGFVSKIYQSAFMGSVSGNEMVGGLVGYNHNTHIYNSFSSGSVSGNNQVGGLTGYRIDDWGDMRDSYSVASVFGNGFSSRVGGLIGEIREGEDEDIFESYWDKTNSPYGINGVGLKTELMLCPQISSDLSCSTSPLIYEDWEAEIWDFGSASEYPAIKMSRGLIRPAPVDSDADSQPDYLDAFPNNPDAWLDTDFDGMPDSWAPGCDPTCQANSELDIDTHVNDTDNDGLTNDIDDDIDNDGTPNVADAMPYDPEETLDADGDGIGNNKDADDDNNGLIEITTLEQLYNYGELFDPEVTSENPQGCAGNTCLGVELLNDLDFDVNGDGQFDVADGELFWDEGQGWKPIGSYNNRFTGIIEGNGFAIRNFYINRPEHDFAALIAATDSAKIRNLKISGSVNSDTRGAFFVGYAERSELTNLIAEGRVKADDYAGGIVADIIWYTEVRNSYANVHVLANGFAGGITGRDQHGYIYDSLAVGVVESVNQPAGGLTGSIWGTDIQNSLSLVSLFSQTGKPEAERVHGHLGGYGAFNDGDLVNSYWAHDVSNLPGDENSATVVELQCPTTISDTSCAAITLFHEWDPTIWDLGTMDQLPGLTIGGLTYRGELLDTDGDRYPDAMDEFPENPAVALDNDGDGYPDGWAHSCNLECQATAEIILDKFPSDPSEWLDTDGDLIGNNEDTDDDGDGVEDSDDPFPLDSSEWEDFDGDLIGDNEDTDDDNDGVLDVDDNNKGQDDGLPFFGTSELAERNISVTTDNGQHASVVFDAAYFTGLNASDVFDDTVEIEGSLNGSVFTLEENALLMPSGRQVIQWVAIDDAGNRSTALEQVVNVYPRVRFDVDESISGEGSDAQVVVRLTGDSPEYPVVVNLQMNAASDTDQDDFAPEFDTALVYQVTIEQGEEETLNREAIFSVPVVQDDVSENDELMLIDLLGVPVEEGEENFFALDDAHKQHSLTITHENLAPTVQIKIEQDGNEVANIAKLGGEVTITALVTDPNGSDVHSFDWTLDENLALQTPITNQFVFSPSDLNAGEYSISVVATDNGLTPLTAEASAVVNIILFIGYVDTDGDGMPDNCPPDCIDMGYTEDTDDDNDGVPDDVDEYRLISVAGFVDSDNDGAPNDCETEACIATKMLADNDDDNDGILDGNDIFPTVAIGELTDTDNDGAPDTCTPECLSTGMSADTDDDNDGLLDDYDEHPKVAITGYTDTDHDGAPDECNTDCLDAGMTADNDDDNDGIIDDNDAYHLIAIGEFVDTDNDGAPDDCETASCTATGMEADTDDDNDGLLDEDDAYRLVSILGFDDNDNDGRPDDCSVLVCVGMEEDLDDDNDGVLDINDAFATDPTESSDFDGDLIGDNADIDDDNDGVLDIDDTNLGQDDGLPVFDADSVNVLNLVVNSVNHTATTIAVNDVFYDQFVATDVVDSEVEYKGTWNNNPLVINNDNELILPAGRQVIQWVAVDDAGNESEVVEQVINVYPRVGFDTATSITGEGSDAKITVKLTGDAPAYPVVVNLQVSELSDITQDDVSDEFVIDQIQQLTIEVGEDVEEPNREVVLTIPVNQDNVAENDELLIVDVLGIHVPEGEQTFIAVNEDANQHAVTVTQENIAPEVALLLKQNDVEVANVVQDAGAVSITAQVTDTNGDDTHTLEWNLGDLPLNAPTGNVLNFDPINLGSGTYPISLTATDDGLNPLSGMGNLDLVVVSSDVAPTLELMLMQDGQPVVNVQKDGGLVTVQVAIIDDEGETGHTLNWDLSALGINAPDGTRLEFDPANITSGIYEISVTVTDESNQTDTKTLSIAVVSADDGRTAGGSNEEDSSGEGGGAMAWYLLLMLSLLWSRRAVVRR